jgi:hypothetical protein
MRVGVGGGRLRAENVRERGTCCLYLFCVCVCVCMYVCIASIRISTQYVCTYVQTYTCITTGIQILMQKQPRTVQEPHQEPHQPAQANTAETTNKWPYSSFLAHPSRAPALCTSLICRATQVFVTGGVSPTQMTG